MNPHPPIQTRDLGQIAYARALELQRALNQQVIDGLAPPTLLLVEHEPVITLTRRKSVRDNLLADENQLAEMGIATEQTDRGGDITYHGPGQLVAYPILKLGDFGLNLSSYMRLLEQAVIDTAGHFGIPAHRECGATGVWVHTPLAGFAPRPKPHTPNPIPHTPNPEPRTPDPVPNPNPNPNPAPAKLCAMGVRIRKNTTMHGLALNVAPDLSHFDLIVPCGLHGRPVTSLQALLGDRCPQMGEVKACLIEAMNRRLVDGTPSCATPSAARGATTGSAPGTSAGS